mgnify:CR=1 FL=1
MPKASVKRSIECQKEQLIDLVLDIEKYPIFVPFCLDAKIYEKKEKGDLLLIVADLTIGKGPFLSLIHISEPTRRRGIGYGGVWV